MSESIPESHKVVRLHPADLTIKVETLPSPKIEHPDDAIVKIKLSGLCGSDLHGYRGHEKINNIIVTGHEFVGEVVALGSSYSPNVTSRPPLYSTLKIGDKVVSPFTSSCGECRFCRLGFTSRCKHQLLFGSELLPGGQAQYVRVPKAGGTLFVINSVVSPAPGDTDLPILSDTSFLLLADILPTGCFAALQTLQHPKILPVLSGARFPLASLTSVLASASGTDDDAERIERLTAYKSIMHDTAWPSMEPEDRVLTLALVGLGPVGMCALVSLLDLLSALNTSFRILAIDLVPARREKSQALYNALPPSARGRGTFTIASPDEALGIINDWTDGLGCNAVLEIVGNNAALTLSYSLLAPFGVLISAGVHQHPPVPFRGRELYAKNMALEFGRCPVRAVFQLAADLLRRRQDVFGGVGEAWLVDRIISLDDAPEAYEKFAKGEWGKVAFDPWA